MAAFEGARAELEDADIALIAASTDSRDKAADTRERLGLGFPIAYGLPMLETASRLGAYYEVRRGILHATGFVVRPGGAIATLHYSSGPIGRLTPTDVTSAIRFWRSQASS